MPPMMGGEVHHLSGCPVKTLKAVPYWGSMTSSPIISPPTLNEVPIGGHLSATAKTFPLPVFPSTTSMPSRHTHNSTPPSDSFAFTPVGYHTKDGRIVWVVYFRAVLDRMEGLAIAAVISKALQATKAAAPMIDEPAGGLSAPKAS